MSNEYDPVDKQNWYLLEKEICILTGFDCTQYNQLFLERRVQSRLLALKVNSYLDYYHILKDDSDEKYLLLEELTIHVTSFFRNKDAYDVFIAQIMMELLKEKQEKNRRTIKIWSAGCSSGEEPYSIAMILLEILQHRISDFFITIIATDISPSIIEKAKKGIYEKEHLTELPLEYIDKYFERKGEIFIIKEEVKKLVRFEVGDILSEDKPEFVDIIFCRNTIIYFETELKKALHMEFYNCLNQRGYLMLGMTEAITGPAKDKFTAVDNIHRIYRKLN